jgi:hypothetical protein
VISFDGHGGGDAREGCARNAFDGESFDPRCCRPRFDGRRAMLVGSS